MTTLSGTENETITALTPRGAKGHQFVFYGDCCSGVPGAPREANFAAVNSVVAKLGPPPEFICFIGDAIYGMADEADEIRRQWRYFLDEEMACLRHLDAPVYHTTSNHNTYDARHEAVWREVFPAIPQNGPVGQEGLSYWVRRDDLLLVFVNTSFSGLGGAGHVEHCWLDQVLDENEDATHKFVIGHHPVHPVNGYEQYPTWQIIPAEGREFWDVLVKHRVLAYLCSHIIAFDAQVHQGVLQVLSGGAGTNYGPGGFMPGQTEYLHCVQAALDEIGFRYQVLDTEGRVRERLSWPFAAPPLATWEPFSEDASAQVSERCRAIAETGAEPIVLWHFEAALGAWPPERQTLLTGWDAQEGPPVVSVQLEGPSPALVVSLVPVAGGGSQEWRAALPEGDGRLDLQFAIHAGMGPGGILLRTKEDAPWSSLSSSSARGAEQMAWPNCWAVGHGQSGSEDRPFRGKDLAVHWTLVDA